MDVCGQMCGQISPLIWPFFFTKKHSLYQKPFSIEWIGLIFTFLVIRYKKFRQSIGNHGNNNIDQKYMKVVKSL